MEAIFQNMQWTVTKSGMESRHHAPLYRIPAERLLETHGGGYFWPDHMARKPWVIRQAFIEAYVAALEALRPEFDRASLNEAVERARYTTPE
jgi:hypothetical protein